MKKILQLILSFLMIACTSEVEKLTDKQFTNKYLEKISEQYPTVNFEIKEPLVIISKFENEEFTHYLDNSFKEYNLSPTELNEIIERYVNSSGSLYEKKEEININQIIPIIKPSSYFEELKRSGIETADLIWENYNEDLIIIYAEDKGNRFNYFNNNEFEKLNIKKDTLLDFARSNLNNIIPKIEKVGKNGEYGLIAGGDYEANLILLNTLWTKDNFKVDGDIIVAIPNRDLVFIIGSNNKQSIEKLKKSIPEYYNTGNHPISDSFYRWTGTKFEKISL